MILDILDEGARHTPSYRRGPDAGQPDAEAHCEYVLHVDAGQVLDGPLGFLLVAGAQMKDPGLDGLAQAGRTQDAVRTLRSYLDLQPNDEPIRAMLAAIEAARVIARDHADVMIVGGVGNRLSLTPLMYRRDSRLSHRCDEPQRACRPFDRDRDGMVNGEGAGALILETRHCTDVIRFGPAIDPN